MIAYNTPVIQTEYHHRDVVVFQPLLVGYTLISRDKADKAAFFCERKQEFVRRSKPSHLSGSSDGMTYKVLPQLYRYIDIKQNPHKINSLTCIAAY